MWPWTTKPVISEIIYIQIIYTNNIYFQIYIYINIIDMCLSKINMFVLFYKTTDISPKFQINICIQLQW